MHGPSYEGHMENEQNTLSLSQLITYNTQMRRTQETPLLIYLGLLIHSKFKSSYLINELHRLGLSVNYNRVKYLERKMGDSVLQQFNTEGVVCPTGMRYGLFTVAAVDNIGHNPTSSTSKDSFHGSAISLFQARYDENDGVKRHFPLMARGPKNLSLSDEFTTLPQLAKGCLKSAPAMLKKETMETECSTLSQEIQKEEEWAKYVISQLDNYAEVE